jgi:hypothetical protein
MFLSLVLASSPALVRGQGSEAMGPKPLMLFPERVPAGRWWTSLGFTAIAPPVEITEELQIRWPAFDYHTIYGLPKGFSVDGRATVQVLQNRISLGPKWTTKIGPLSGSVGWDVAYWFGALEVGGFDSKGHGWEGTPNISLGYRFGEVAATAKAEMLMVYSVSSSQGDLEVSSTSKLVAGTAFTLALEQPFYGDQYLTLAFRAMYSKFFWETWSLFTTFDRYLFYPEITVGWIL